MKNQDLWNRIEAFELDMPGAIQPFSKRLAQENKWTYAFALESIEEYKKFIYLACISNHPVSPSYPIDQVWHLHLIYTKSYWIDFCKSVLEKEIHHKPSTGNKEDKAELKALYKETLSLYQDEFKTRAPEHIWTFERITKASKKPLHNLLRLFKQ